MRVTVVLRVLSVFLLLLSSFLLLSLLVALLSGEFYLTVPFLAPVGINVLAFFLIYPLTSKNKARPLSVKGGFLFVTLAWITASFSGALPAFISGEIPSYTDAFFETMSGFTTTGASILTNIEGLSKGLLFWRSLTHWLGGMGIVVLTVAIFPLMGTGGLQLLKAEAPGPSVDKITPRITQTAKILWLIYCAFTVLETVLLMFGGMDLYDALTHTFGTLATGGFSPKSASVGHYSSGYIHVVITVFMMMAGVNFILYHRLFTGNLPSIRRNSEFKAYISIFLAASLIIGVNLYHQGLYPRMGISLRYAGFQAASILTTTGYATADFAAWPFLSKTVLFILMFVGGCAGSTGGAIKVVRIVTLFKLGFNELKYLIHPRGVFNIRVNGGLIKKDIVYGISGFFFLYILLLLLITGIVGSAGNDLITSFTSALATLGNIGPGFGKIGPTLNYASFPDYVKWFLSMAMMLGRLEIYTVLVLFSPLFWKKY